MTSAVMNILIGSPYITISILMVDRSTYFQTPGNGCQCYFSARRTQSIALWSATRTTHRTQQSSLKDLFIHCTTTKKGRQLYIILVIIIQEIPGRRQTEKQLGDAKENGRGEK